MSQTENNLHVLLGGKKGSKKGSKKHNKNMKGGALPIGWEVTNGTINASLETHRPHPDWQGFIQFIANNTGYTVNIAMSSTASLQPRYIIQGQFNDIHTAQSLGTLLIERIATRDVIWNQQVYEGIH